MSLLLLLVDTSRAFVPQNQHEMSSRTGVMALRSPVALTTMRMESLASFGSMNLVNEFFETQPFLAAFVTCSLKASTADLLAQTATKEEEEPVEVESTVNHMASIVAWLIQENNGDLESPSSSSTLNWNRTLAFYLYGGLYQGMFLQFLYTTAYPYLFGGHPHQLQLQVHTEIVVFGPFLTLPLAYVIRACIDAVANESLVKGKSETLYDDGLAQLSKQATEGLEKYKNHILTQNLLIKYWAIWGPAQTINFLVVPPHLRVVFVALVSFFWVYLFSMISSHGIETAPSEAGEASPMNNNAFLRQARLSGLYEEFQNAIPATWRSTLASPDNLGKYFRSV